ncbi:head scaffolding protein [Gordonia phage GRU1]|uniref:Scaffolding protein n=1 Tax=Gordonia phage GRU1 TaxID=1109710 RepID=G8EJX6_9CAUD|nr:head scaffolding protein [Gordonia phage GRU1]AET09858.1 hypothetical protein [Gordonia phage GRU1]
MKHTNKSRIIAAAMPLDGMVPFSGRPARAGRAIPRRDPDPNEHGGKGGKGGKPGENDDDDDDDDDDPKPIVVKDTEEYKTRDAEAKAEKRRADAAEAELKKLREAGLSDDEKTRERERDEAVRTAVTDKETELTDHYEGVIGGLQQQIIDSEIDGILGAGGFERKKFEDVIASLDTSRFIKDDGSVDREKVKKVFTPVIEASTSRPPRTSTTRVARNTGFGRYLEDQD